MAILSKIRERSMFLIVIIGLALFAFVASPKDILDFFNSSKVNSVGEINGETISRKDFGTRVEAYKSNVGNGVSDMQAVNAVWNSVLSEKIYQEQLKNAGIVVGEKDVWDAIVEIPSIKNAEIFKNEIGLFDEDKFKEYLANLKENSKGQANSAWTNWLNTEKNVKANVEQSAYTQLVKLGVGASLKDGERNHFENGTKLSGSFVYVPYSSIEDADATVSSSEIDAYVKSHAAEFKVDATRDIKYVKFDIVASEEDEKDIQDELKLEIAPFTAAKDGVAYIAESGTDIPVDGNYLFKNNLPTVVADEIFAAKEGVVVGPYKFQNHYRLSKVEEFIKMPDSVQASHILISYVGSRSADPTITRTEAEAQKLADSILKVVKRKKSKFASLAKEFSSDKSNSEKGGELDWFTYSRMVPEFRDYTFLNKKGDIGVVKTDFGLHVIHITNQKNIQNAVKLSTLARKIEASEATENTIFENAESLAYKLSSGETLDELLKELNYTARPLVGIKELEENVSGLGKNRSIVRWTFDNERSINDVKRFDLDNGYAVVVLTNKSEKGLSSSSKASAKVKPILMNQKKAKLIAEKMKGADLEAIAKSAEVAVKSFSNVTLGAPTISGVGIEPGVVGAMYAVAENKVITNVSGVKGVFAFVVKSKEKPATLPSYEGAKNSLATDNKNKVNGQIFNALKDLVEVDDQRGNMY
ncbi:peptidylprolyl isomerase [Flavicella sediminum]|uniref:peptidylprolyl isomerase n=1 Tax=Flavicella sediminum TaxID=2585141 RepID=UPI00111E683C|nr:peptidylprolyl isomerase [Flavicella sediminum]